jgi:CRP-like cAMP-binding protein
LAGSGRRFSLPQNASQKKEIHMTNGTQWLPCLAYDHWFSELPAYLQDSLLLHARQRRVATGKRLFKRGDPACGLYAVVAGTVRFNAVAQQRDALPVADVRFPYWFGELSLFDLQPRAHDVFSLKEAIVLQIPQAILLQMLDERPHYWRYFADLLGRKLGLKVPVPTQITSLPTAERVAFRLLMLSEGYGEADNSQRIVPLDRMASERCLGLIPEVLERELQVLQARHIIAREQDTVLILDSDRLRRAAEHRLTL